MLDNEPNNGSSEPIVTNEAATAPADGDTASAETKPKKAAKKAAKTTRARKATKAKAVKDAPAEEAAPAPAESTGAAAAEEAAPAKSTRRRRPAAVFEAPPSPEPARTIAPEESEPGPRRRPVPAPAVFVAPAQVEAPPAKAASASETADARDGEEATASRSRRRSRKAAAEPVQEAAPAESEAAAPSEETEDEDDGSTRHRRRRGRRGRGRGKGPHEAEAADEEGDEDEDDEEDESGAADGMTRRRRRRRRRGASSGGADETESEDGVVTVVKIREPRSARDEVQGVSGSTRLEAKRQRRRDGRDQRRTRPSILSESEFLARREAVDRVMAIRQKGDRTQIAVLEDGVLVEHYVTRASSGSMVGNVYLGKVQNVLPSMEAAFVDIGRGRNAVLYAGEVNWDMAGLEGRARSIEQALKSGDSVLVQVTKDPIGHKGARLTSHVALSGRHLVYVPNGNASGISRKLPDTERKRLRDILKKLVPEGAGVIVRTAAEGASEDELERDVKRLSAQWADIESKVAAGGAPVQLYEEPDLVIRVVRDLFNEDFRELVIQGSDAYDMVESYLGHVSPDLVARLRRHTDTTDIYTSYRIDEQILKGLDRKVFLPSGGSLVIDRTEAMAVIDVNTGKYTGTGGNLEETVTRNNLEAAEEIVRQLRLRDLGGIVVIDFIDMVLESNRELVLRRLTECLGRDRTKHQVTEITSLGLVQMTRKRIGQGLLEAFSETCEHCKGRGLIMHLEPVPDKRHAPAADEHDGGGSGRKRGRRGRGGGGLAGGPGPEAAEAEPEVGEDLADSADADVDDEVEEDDTLEPGASAADADADESVVISNSAAPARAEGASTTQTTTSNWPPKASSWVNLGAAPPIGTSDSSEQPSEEAAPSGGSNSASAASSSAGSGSERADAQPAPEGAGTESGLAEPGPAETGAKDAGDGDAGSGDAKDAGAGDAGAGDAGASAAGPGAAPTDLPPAQPMHVQEPTAELAGLEGEVEPAARRRGSRWRLRP